MMAITDDGLPPHAAAKFANEKQQSHLQQKMMHYRDNREQQQQQQQQQRLVKKPTNISRCAPTKTQEKRIVGHRDKENQQSDKVVVAKRKILQFTNQVPRRRPSSISSNSSSSSSSVPARKALDHCPARKEATLSLSLSSQAQTQAPVVSAHETKNVGNVGNKRPIANGEDRPKKRLRLKIKKPKSNDTAKSSSSTTHHDNGNDIDQQPKSSKVTTTTKVPRKELQVKAVSSDQTNSTLLPLMTMMSLPPAGTKIRRNYDIGWFDGTITTSDPQQHYCVAAYGDETETLTEEEAIVGALAYQIKYLYRHQIRRPGVGTLVQKNYGDDGWFCGKVVSQDATKSWIEFEDGEEEEMSDEELVMTAETYKLFQLKQQQQQQQQQQQPRRKRGRPRKETYCAADTQTTKVVKPKQKKKPTMHLDSSDSESENEWEDEDDSFFAVQKYNNHRKEKSSKKVTQQGVGVPANVSNGDDADDSVAVTSRPKVVTDASQAPLVSTDSEETSSGKGQNQLHDYLGALASTDKPKLCSETSLSDTTEECPKATVSTDQCANPNPNPNPEARAAKMKYWSQQWNEVWAHETTHFAQKIEANKLSKATPQEKYDEYLSHAIANSKRPAVGDKVRKRWDIGYFNGEVIDVENNKYRVRYSDGEEEDMSDEEIDLATNVYNVHTLLQQKHRPTPGTRVRKRFDQGWFDGTLMSHELTGRAYVLFDDGDDDYLSDQECRIAAMAYELHHRSPR